MNPGAGKPPKDVSTIRHALDALHSSGPARPQGPLAQGIGDARIPVVSFARRDVALEFQQALLEAGVMSSLSRLRRRTQVEVDATDRFQAVEHLRRFEARLDPERLRPLPRHFDFTVFCLAAALTLDAILVFGLGRNFSWSAAYLCGMFLALSLVFGLLLDFVRVNLHRMGRGQFGISGLFLLILAAAVSMVLLRLFSQTLFRE
jgi:hypothetical protein